MIDSISEPTASGRRPSDQRRLRPPHLLPQLVSAEQVLEAKHHGSGNGVRKLGELAFAAELGSADIFQYCNF